MAIEKHEVSYAKEIDDCLALVVQIVKDIHAGKSALEIASSGLPSLIDAISGVNQVKAEIEENLPAVISTTGHRVGEIIGALLNK